MLVNLLRPPVRRNPIPEAISFYLRLSASSADRIVDMEFDIRLPIGLMFAIFGTVLTTYGLLSDPSIYQRSLGINMNLNWGAVLLISGFVLLYFGRRAGSKS